MDRAIPRVPTNKMKRISQMLYDVGYKEVPPWTDRALNLHEYHYNGPDPDQALSKYNSPEEAAHDILTLVEEVVKVVEGLRDGGKVKWNDELDSALRDVKNILNKLMSEYLRRPG